MADLIQTEEELDDVLTKPRPALIEFIRNLPSPLVVLGAGGKMGPTLCVLARRAADAAGHRLDIVAVSRFSDEQARAWLEQRGITTQSVDLLEPHAMQKLPDAANVVYLVGLKFGTTQNPCLTWAANTLASAHTAERYASARIVALSTGNVYPLAPVASGGATEKHPLTPLGEYANAAVARERIFEYYSNKNATPMALMRLNYAVELRYGVLVDIARRVWAGEPVDLSNGFFNCIWQGDANEMVLRSLSLAGAPARAWNLTSPEVFRVRQTAERFGELLGKKPEFVGQESDNALLGNAAKLCAELGRPATPLETVMRWTAYWVKQGGRYLNKPTHFEVRDGAY